MTEPRNPTPETQSSPNPDAEKTRPNRANITGFFNRVRQELNPEEEPVHPSEAAEIVIMEEGDERTRL
jgi:hypothetical protein